MFKLLNREHTFFDLFNKSAQNCLRTAQVLDDLLCNFVDVPNKVRQMKNLEHQGDELTHQMLDYLAKTFITPLDREDIHKLASRLDDVVDQMDTAANRLSLFQVRNVPPDAREFGKVLIRATSLLIEAFENLRNLKKPEAIIACCVEIHTQENEGDRLMQHALAELFAGPNPDPVEIIKWKDIYQILEKATDRCEDVANVIQTIVVKHG